MATKKKGKKKRISRSTESYLNSAKELAKLVPRLKKYRRRKKLSKYDKYSISKAEKILRGVRDLHPVTKKQARKLKSKKLFAPGVRAIRLRGVPPETKIKISKRGDIELVYKGTRWIYWSLDRETVRSKRGMKSAASKAFQKQFPIEIIGGMAETAFKKLNVQAIALWTHAGRSDATFSDLKAFVYWVNEKWNAGRYMRADQYGELKDESDPGKWIEGLAIEIENPEYTKRRRALKNEKDNN